MSYYPGGGATGTVSSIRDVPGLETELSAKAPAVHNHDGSYQAAGSYAAAAHNHDGVYAVVGHTHLGSAVVGYALNGYAANAATTTDGQTIYFGGTPAVAPSTTGGNHRIYIPKAGAIKAAYVYCHAATAGSAEAWSANVRLNNTTDTLVQSLSLSNANRMWSNTNLNIAVAAGDFVEVKMVNPTWATNPANVRFAVTLYIE